jgi:hypothetical protein
MVLRARRRAVETAGYAYEARLRGLMQVAQATFMWRARALTRRVACVNRTRTTMHPIPATPTFQEGSRFMVHLSRHT